ncbi:endoglucanase B [Cordyceps militaris CM01]|uniref:lytic cellulose monooxygenase (C4-dehydrogenating) n=1 Tax=Cordyceps militaris (strain CM01) TaxID=983644 RepID=G3JM31_CORMM|nr:endoglucanase B [Cordyceps militaris CM01]EGX90755.1 endoglucanase B [Cordyceps militaris CM01]
MLALASAATAHTLFTTLYINGKNQGDGTCVRMPKSGATGTSPIYPITGDAMACGYGGRDPVPFVCPAASGAKLTFEFRLWPDAQHPGAIDEGHKGPCAVYLKRVDDMFADPPAGDGWFKIWDDGYDSETKEWCSDRLRAHDGLLSVNLPTGLAPGYYLVRPEILALHFAYKGDPQFFLGCAQIFVQGGPAGAVIPKDKTVSIPGYVNAQTPGLGFDINKEPLPAYPMPGPAVYLPPAAPPSSSVQALKQAAQQQQQQQLSKGAVPQTCLIKNANWCAKEVAPYTDMEGCWAAVKECYAQSKVCWDSARASGSANCYTWSDYCTAMNDACEREEFQGPPAFDGKEKYATAPDDIPEPGGDTEMGGGEERVTATTSQAPPGEPACTKTARAGDGKTIGGGGLKWDVSKDGKCGPEFGQTCSGSAFGNCCSKNMQCGSDARHCSCGCSPEYGSCW